MVTRGATVRWFALGAALVPGLLAQDAPDEVETESGLRYVDLRIGDGESPGSGDGVEIHYVHTREDGTVVEETREWGDPVRFRLGGRTPVSPLFEEGLRSMCAGGLRRLRIVPEPDAREPAGALGSGPPGVPLLYEVELVSVRHPPPRPAYDETKLERNASGVAWTVLAPGSGEALDSGRIAGLQLSAWLADGRLVECTPLSGRSYRFLLGAAGTPGWTADLAGMRVGERRLLVVPPGSGFGEDGVPGVIPPGATLVLDVLLEEVGPPPAFPGIDPATFQRHPSGLLFRDVEVGSGPSPDRGRWTVFRYSIWLAQGETLVDGTALRGEPTRLDLGRTRLVRGLELGLLTMKTRGRRVLVIPPMLAYRGRGNGGTIPPDATLVVELEVLAVK